MVCAGHRLQYLTIKFYQPYISRHRKWHIRTELYIQLISGVFEHSVLRVWEIYALENAVFSILLYNTEYANTPEINCAV